MDDNNFKSWGEENITWAGTADTNFSHRRGMKPQAIVNHITSGTASSAINWFTSSNNKNSSAHFLVDKKGKIYQFVKIEDNAWANGLTAGIKAASSELVNQHGANINPNWYTVSIEHESFTKNNGKLTHEQLEASINLHRYIILYVKNRWGVDISIDRKHILGHYEIDIVNRAFCPGSLFPFDEIISALKNVKSGPNIIKTEKEINYLHNLGILNTPEYWIKNAVKGNRVEGEFAAILIQRTAELLRQINKLTGGM